LVENSQGASEPPHEAGKPGSSRRVALRFSIGVRIVGLTILMVLLIGIISGFVLINTSRNSIRQTVLENNLAQAQLAASFTPNYMQVIEAHILVFADRPDVRQAILANTPEQLQSALAELVRVQTVLNGAGVYDANGIQKASNVANSTTIGQSYADREWFQQALATGQPCLGVPVISRTTG